MVDPPLPMMQPHMSAGMERVVVTRAAPVSGSNSSRSKWANSSSGVWKLRLLLKRGVRKVEVEVEVDDERNPLLVFVRRPVGEERLKEDEEDAALL